VPLTPVLLYLSVTNAVTHKQVIFISDYYQMISVKYSIHGVILDAKLSLKRLNNKYR